MGEGDEQRERTKCSLSLEEGVIFADNELLLYYCPATANCSSKDTHMGMKGKSSPFSPGNYERGETEKSFRAYTHTRM